MVSLAFSISDDAMLAALFWFRSSPTRIIRRGFAVSIDALLYLGMRNGKNPIYKSREGIELLRCTHAPDNSTLHKAATRENSPWIVNGCMNYNLYVVSLLIFLQRS